MRLLSSVIVAVVAIVVAAPVSQGQTFERRNAIVEAVKKTKDAIITIKITRANGSKEVVGTGVIVDERGLIVTNKHVVGSGKGVFVCLTSGDELPGDVLLDEASHDLAVVRVKAGKTLPALRLAPATDLMVGEDVIAIGHPYGYVHTVSRGIISALDRKITLPTGDELTGLIQTDASINPGNSGGPLLNINGEFIGINVALREGAQGIAFAINAGTVEKVLSKHFSALKVSGIFHGLKTEGKVFAQTGDRQRLVIKEVIGDLQPNDEIVVVNNRNVANSFDLERAFWGKKAGEVVQVKVIRQGKEVSASLTLNAGEATQAVATVTTSTRPTSSLSLPASIRR